ncbi:MAG: endonuclease/exonuclease/phosphatase family protein [Nocardioidaceae bacterium]
MTFNVRTSSALDDGLDHWWLRRHRVLRTLREAGAQVVALQEVRPGQLRYLSRRLPDHRVAASGRDRDGRGEACPVLVGPGCVLDGWEVRWLSPEPDVAGSRFPGATLPRICTLARVTDVATGARLTVANTHLDHRRRDLRARSARLLRQWAEADDRPWVVVGDLNCAVDAPELAPLLDGGWSDALASLPPRGSAAATFHGFTGTADGARIDHVLVPAAVEVAASRVVRATYRPASDHWPVVADLRPRPAGAAGTPGS